MSVEPETVQLAVQAVEKMCGPELMTKEDAIEFLEAVIVDLESAKEALEEEIEEENNDGGGESDGEGKDT